LFTCTLKGTLKKERGRIKNLIAVGDFVHIDPQGEKEGSIAYIEERKSILSRAENHMRQMEQLIAVNIDQVLITTSVTSPQFKPFLIDRYIIAAKKGNMTPLIVINKIDLLNSASEEEKAQYLHFIEVYRNLGFSIFPVSVVTGEGIAELKEVMQGKASVFSGQSGVGKSSLINALTGSSLRIGEIVAKTSKGSHTTTTTHLIPLEGDAFCIDTPGIKSFGLWELTRTDIQNYFSEIQQIGKKCHYPDCSHLQEPDCAVQKAVAKGKISPLRFDSYSALMATLFLKHLPR
ncbi:MAG: ribosome small subunit-dependent GTPase A, partial [Chlamydiales bacterium]